MEFTTKRVILIPADDTTVLEQYVVDLPGGGKSYRSKHNPGRDKENPENLCGEIAGREVFQGKIQIGWLIRVCHHRTWKWHAVRNLPTLAPDGWYRKEDLPAGRRTIQEAVADLI